MGLLIQAGFLIYSRIDAFYTNFGATASEVHTAFPEISACLSYCSLSCYRRCLVLHISDRHTVPEGLHFFGRGLAARLCVGDGHVHAARVQHHERPVGGKVHAHNGARNLVNISIRAKIGKGTQ